jgi:hypothetical protein
MWESRWNASAKCISNNITGTTLRIKRQNMLSEGRVLSLRSRIPRRPEYIYRGSHISVYTDFTEHWKGIVLQPWGFKVRTTRFYRTKAPLLRNIKSKFGPEWTENLEGKTFYTLTRHLERYKISIMCSELTIHDVQFMSKECIINEI